MISWRKLIVFDSIIARLNQQSQSQHQHYVDVLVLCTIHLKSEDIAIEKIEIMRFNNKKKISILIVKWYLIKKKKRRKRKLFCHARDLLIAIISEKKNKRRTQNTLVMNFQ